MMRFHLRTAGAVALLALLITPVATFAQDAPVTVAGSGVVAPVFEALAASADATDGVNVQVTGTNAGFQALCSGEAQVALATRAISVEEETACNNAGVAFYEVLAGHNVVAFVGSPDAPQCLTLTELSTALAPSAQGQVQNWNQLNAAFPDQPLTIYGPAVETAGYALVDRLVDGVGLRGDLQTFEDRAVASEAGSLAIVSLAEAQALGDSVRIINVDSQDGTGCATPSGETVENRTYPAAESLFIYVAADAAANESVAAIISTLTGEDGSAVVADAGFTPATATAYGNASSAIEAGTTGRQFTVDATDFQISTTLAGALSIGGSPSLVQYFTDLTAEFTAQYPAVTTETSFLGATSGIARLCAGTLDIAVVDYQVQPDDLAACEGTNVIVEQARMGAEAVVLVASADADYLSCLSVEQLATTWQAGSEATTWNQISDDFAEAPVYLFAPAEGSSTSADILMIESTGTARPIRSDIAERSNDPLYRAAAVANAGSGLTIMSWPEYQSVVNAGQEGIQLVSVSEGGDCVEPSVSTIADGSYTLARPVSLLVSQSALARPEVQALLWTTLLDENYGLLQLADLVGIEFGDLPNLRNGLQAQFNAAAEAAAQPAPSVDVTAEPEAEATEAADQPAAEADATESAEAADDAEPTAEATEAE
jgi:phosphate transport system substrate-binding protein